MFTDNPYRTIGDYYRFRLGAGYNTHGGSLMLASAQGRRSSDETPTPGVHHAGTGGRETQEKEAA